MLAQSDAQYKAAWDKLQALFANFDPSSFVWQLEFQEQLEILGYARQWKSAQ